MTPFNTALCALVLLAACEWAWRRWRRLPTAPRPAFATVPTRYRTLAQAMQTPDNLLLLRLLAASVVIYAHSYASSSVKTGGDAITRSGVGVYSGSIAVYVFFVVSGFLVSGSWVRRRSLADFIAARVLRIVPALAACLAVSAGVLGALLTTLPTAEYFAHPDTLRYLTRNLQFDPAMQGTLPGVFETNKRQTVNGSLWTLPAEARMYVLLALFGVLGLLSRTWLTALGILALGGWMLLQPGKVPLLDFRLYIPMAACFALGTLAWSTRHVLPLNVWILAALLALTWALHGSRWHLWAFLPTLAYASLWFAYAPLKLQAFNRLGDYSYGLYLWGFPLQQLAAHLWQGASPTLISLFAWPTALACAIVSWHAIEKPAMALRRRPRAAPNTPADPATAER